MPKHKETLRLAEYANIIMEVLFLLKLIKSFIEAHCPHRAAQRPQDALCWGTEPLGPSCPGVGTGAERGGPARKAAPAAVLPFSVAPLEVRGPCPPGAACYSPAAAKSFCVLQVNYILESRASTARAEYFAQKQRKLNRRTSFSFQKEKKSGQQ